jgi:hypothetical protein
MKQFTLADPIRLPIILNLALTNENADFQIDRLKQSKIII